MEPLTALCCIWNGITSKRNPLPVHPNWFSSDATEKLEKRMSAKNPELGGLNTKIGICQGVHYREAVVVKMEGLQAHENDYWKYSVLQTNATSRQSKLTITG